MTHYLSTLPSSSDSDPLFPSTFRAKLVEAMKWAATRNNIPSAVVNTHSLRAGGATALFSGGVDWISIQRWGRWKSFAFHDYVWHDYTGFMELGCRIASTKGLNKFLVDVAPNHKKVRFETSPDHTTGSLMSLSWGSASIMDFPPSPFCGSYGNSRHLSLSP